MDSESERPMESVSPQRRVQIVQSSGSQHDLDALFDASVLSQVKPLRERGLPPSFFQQPHLAAKNSAVHSRTASLPVNLQERFASVNSNQNLDMEAFSSIGGNGSEELGQTQFLCANENQAPFSGANNNASAFNNASSVTPFGTVNVNNQTLFSSSSAQSNPNRTFPAQTAAQFAAQNRAQMNSQQYLQTQFAADAAHVRQSSWDAFSSAAGSTNVASNGGFAYQTVPSRASMPSTVAPVAVQQMTFERCKCVEQPLEPLSLDRLLSSARLYTTHGNPIVSEELVTLTEFARLLPGWQCELTADRQLYFVDHACQRTTWFHPRIPIEQQRNAPFVVVNRQTYSAMVSELERRQRSAAGTESAPRLPPRGLRQAPLAIAAMGVGRQLTDQSSGQQQQQQQQQQFLQAQTALSSAIHGRARSDCYGGSNWQVAEQLDLATADEIGALCDSSNQAAVANQNASSLAPSQVNAMHARSASYPAHLLMDTSVAIAGDQAAMAARGQNSFQPGGWNGQTRVNASQPPLSAASTFGSLAHPLTVAAPHPHANVMSLSQHSQLTNSPSSLASSSPAHHLTASSSMEFHARQESSDSGLSSVPHTMPHTPEDTLAAASGYSTAAAARYGTPPNANANVNVGAKTPNDATNANVNLAAGVHFDDAHLGLGVGSLDTGEMSVANFSLMTLQDDAFGFVPNPNYSTATTPSANVSALGWGATY